MGGDVSLNDHALERLDFADVEAGGLLAASHVHRYEFAATLSRGRRVLDLCCGTGYGSAVLAREATAVHGVDISDEAVAAARSQYAEGSLTFEAADALAFLRAQPQGRFDVVVCFEGIEHVPEPEAVADELARLADGGARIVLSLPNSKGFEEDNEFHVTDFGYETMRELVARLGDCELLEQRIAEASLIGLSGAAAGPLRGRQIEAADDPSSANHWIAVRGVDRAEIEDSTALLTFAAEAHHSRYMRTLEEANAELRRINAQLGREFLGVHDAAAAATIRRLEEVRDAAVAEAERVRVEARQRLEIEIEVAKHNDELFQQARAQLARRPYRLVMALERRASKVPVARRLLR